MHHGLFEDPTTARHAKRVLEAVTRIHLEPTKVSCNAQPQVGVAGNLFGIFSLELLALQGENQHPKLIRNPIAFQKGTLLDSANG